MTVDIFEIFLLELEIYRINFYLLRTFCPHLGMKKPHLKMIPIKDN